MTDKETKEYVYFVLYNHGIDPFVKIGKSNNEAGVLSRFSSIQTGSPKELNLLGYIEGSEDEWHRMLVDHRARGEWFYYYRIKTILASLDLIVPQKILDNYKKKVINELEEEMDKSPHEGTQSYYKSRIKETEKKLKDKELVQDYRAAILSSKFHNESHGWWRFDNEPLYKEANENINNIQKVLNFIHNGVDGWEWSGYSDVTITECKRATLDVFDWPINVGESYFRTGSYGVGYSLTTGYRIYKLFWSFMQSRKRNRNYYKRGIGNVENEGKRKLPTVVEKESLKAICDYINEDIKQQLGIKFYDYNVQSWRDMENEKTMPYVTEYLDEIEKLKKKGSYDPKAIKNYDE